jgi:hypothetical protein
VSRESMLCHIVLTNFHFHRWCYYHHEFILDWLCVHSWTQTLCIKEGGSDLHLPQFSSWHDVSSQFSSVKAGRQQMWVRQQEFCSNYSCSTFDRAEQFIIAELCCLSRKCTLWLLCGCSCKAFWSAIFVMIL